MQTISTRFTATTSIEFSTQGAKAATSAKQTGFDTLLSDAESRLSAQEFAASLLEKISLTLNQNLQALGKKSSAKNDFPFSSAFEATFGNSGPLIDFINEVTDKLNLSAEQNRALQDIAIRNKDATRSRESVNKIAAELRLAGITA